MELLKGLNTPLIMDKELAEIVKGVLTIGLDNNLRNRIIYLGNITTRSILTLLYTFQYLSDNREISPKDAQKIITNYTRRTIVNLEIARELLDIRKTLGEYKASKILRK